MAVVFNADEVFEMAQQIERNGARFYRRASEATTDARVRQLLLDLAAWEEQHEKTFGQMRSELSERERRATVFDPEGEGVRYLRAMVEGKVFDLEGDPTAWLGSPRNLEDIIRYAIAMEKDSIIFYLALRDLVPESLGRDRIDRIISEEMGHIKVLSQRLAIS